MMRHTEAYPFSNLWLKTNTRLPDGKSTGYLNTEIPLAEESGKWLGRGMNEIWEHKMPLTKNGGAMHFSQTGQYTISLKQIMRMNPLPEIMSMGIRLEKVPR
jgi:gliding motility-associated lipoprotein GldH